MFKPLVLSSSWLITLFWLTMPLAAETVQFSADMYMKGPQGEEFGRIYVGDDVTRFSGTDFPHEDCRDIEKSRTIARLYIPMWLNAYREELAARIWNGGPRGWEKKSTVKYRDKVEAAK